MESVDIFTAYGSNAFRLTLKQWCVVLALCLPVFLVPMIWRGIEKLEVGGDSRMNYELSGDYWLYGNRARLAAEKYETVVLGDSVIWGQYVTPSGTLTHYLNEAAGAERFGNLGLDGAHPLALAGLIEHYGGAIRGKKVILLCNPLWMSSPKHDLQGTEEFRFNHPRLIPQCSPLVPCYYEPISSRLGVIAERNVELLSWTAHLQQAYFEKKDIPTWTIEHPYSSPLSMIKFAPPPDDGKLRHEPLSWTAQGIKRHKFEFVPLHLSAPPMKGEPGESQQWRAFLRAVEVLQLRNNSVVVMINALNEHMMTPESQKVYLEMRRAMEQELKAKNVKVFAPTLLPSEEYADASHPLSEGYKRMASEFLAWFRTGR